MFLVRQAFTSMLAKRGTVLVCGCIGYHLDGLLSQCSVALNHFDFVYCCVVCGRCGLPARMLVIIE